MSESESNDLDRDVDASMRMFEKSKVGPAATIIPAKPGKVLLVLDGSPQDDSSTNAANHLQSRFRSETLILDARDKAEGDETDLAADRAAAVPGSVEIKRGEGDAYDVILAAIDEHQPDLLIVPCPFGRSFEHIGSDSAGTVIDVLLSRCPKPILVIRRDDQLLADCAKTVSMIVGGECEMENVAAAWVFGLAATAATVTLNLVIEKEQFENIRSILEALDPDTNLDPEQFSDALTKTHQSIHGAMAKTATSLGMNYHLKPVAGEIAPPNPLSESERMLLVLPLEVDDRFAQGFVQDRIRRSPHPVLIVPGHVAT
ncbi:MAG: universal stress protein [Rubripirellula sp.]